MHDVTLYVCMHLACMHVSVLVCACVQRNDQCVYESIYASMNLCISACVNQ